MLSLDCYQFGWAGNAQKRSESEKVVVVVRWVGGGERTSALSLLHNSPNKNRGNGCNFMPINGPKVCLCWKVVVN